MSNSTTSTEEQLRMSSSQIDQLDREKTRLVEQLKEVIKMNTHWQRYDSQREQYVLKLTRTNQELQSQILDLQHRLEEVNLTKETKIKNSKPKTEEALSAAENKSGNDESELKVLRTQEEVAVLTDRIAKLKDRVVELEEGRESRKKEDDDQLALLREQVNVCVEDFQQERKDRERIHGENERLRERLAQTEKRIMDNEEQMFVYEEQIKELRGRHHPVPKPGAQKGYDEPCCYPGDRPHIRDRAPAQAQNAYRHPMYFGDDLTDLPRDVEVDCVADESYDETDGIPTITTDATESENRERKEGYYKEEETLQCPRCLASFGLEKQTDLINHIDKCVEQYITC